MDTKFSNTQAWLNKTVFITGGLGFIGTTLGLRLARLGAKIKILDPMYKDGGAVPRHYEELKSHATVFIGDHRDTTALEECTSGADVVFNLAGKTDHLGSMALPESDLGSNVSSHLALLSACHRNCPKARVVYTSTRQVYGKPLSIPVSESHLTDPLDINGIHKFAGEMYHRLYHRVYGLQTTILRLTNVLGPRMRIKDHSQNFLGCWILAALQNDPIPVWGGEQVRDILDVEDCVDALLLAGCHPSAPGETFNVGSPVGFRLVDIAERLIAAQQSGRVQIMEYPKQRKPIEIGNFTTDNCKMTQTLGWTPHITLEQSLQRCLTFYRDHRADYA
jgi:UDP-glucose 4-epimerase